MKTKLPFLMLSFFLLIFMKVRSQNLPSGFSRVSVASNITSPTAMAFAPDGRIFICQQDGKLRVIKNGSLLSTPAVTLTTTTTGERGLIGVAIDPAFATNKYIYLYYTVPENTERTAAFNRVVRYTMNGDVVTTASRTVIINLTDLAVNTKYHNGGCMKFGTDGKLYIATGDNQNGNNSQNLDNYLGKILRVNPDGTIPTGNPFTGGAARSRIWTYGLRNPFSFDIQAGTGRVFVNEVGNSTWEEINNSTTKGLNFGWPAKEGICTSGCTGFTNPVYTYQTNRNGGGVDGIGCAITGGTFLNAPSTNYPATYVGKYFFIDYCNNWINYIDPASPATRRPFATNIGSSCVFISTGRDGNLYYLSRGNGTLYRISYNGSTAPVIAQHPQSASVSQGNSVSFTVVASGSATLTYQWRKNAVNISGATSSTYTITNVQSTHAGQYSVVVSNSVGSATSNNATLTVTAPNANPVPVISTPVNTSLYRGGDVVNFSGTATDQEDGTLPAGAFNWDVILHHANHTHGGPVAPDGVRSGSFTIERDVETDADVWYELVLTVTDSKGATGSTSIRLNPVKANLTLASSPTGLELKLDAVPLKAPYTVLAVSGVNRLIEPVSPQIFNGVSYVFDYWAHGGSATQMITMGDNNITYTAHFKIATPVIFTPRHDAYVRAGTYASTTHGTTDPTVLITKVSSTNISDNNNRESYLTFDLSSLASSPSSVILKVYGALEDTRNTNVPVGVYSVASTSWTESAITWNNKPTSSTATLSTATITDATKRYYSWDITNYVKSEIAAGRKVVSFALKAQQITLPRILWNSKETGSNAPRLEVVTSTNLPAASVKNITDDIANDADGSTGKAIEVYPNPVNNLVNVKLHASISEGEISVINPAGVEMYKSKIVKGENVIDLTGIPSGTYTIKVSANGNTWMEKVLKQ